MIAALAVALLVHAGAIGVFELLGSFDIVSKLDQAQLPLPSASPLATAEDDRPMEIETIVNQLDRPEEKTAEEKKREEQVKKEEDDKSPHGQVVDLAKPAIEQRPDKASYVSEYDSKVDKETRHNGRDQAGAPQAVVPPTGSPDVREPRAAEAGKTAQQEQGKAGKPGPLATREPDRRRAEEQKVEGPAPTENGELERAGSPGQKPLPVPPREQAGENGTGKPQPASKQGHQAEQPGLPGERKPNLQATPDMLQKAIGKGSGSMDYLKDVEDGESTALNSKRWKHAPFFNRVKRAVANEWHPEVVYVRHDPNGNVYGVKDRVTVLRVHLNPDGKLAAWTVMQSSGVDFLDDEAIDAFRKAAPFPNPPKELVETDGQIHFNFAFIFELSGRGSLKVFKYN